MWHLRSFLVAIASLCAAVSAARADDYEPAVAVQCRGNALTVRFGWHDNDAPVIYNPLPAALAKKWSGVKLHADGRCRLADGTSVVARAGAEQSFGYGIGGGDPPEFFSLWIGGKRVASRAIYKDGYGSQEPGVAAAAYGPKGLATCSYATNDDAGDFSEPGFQLTQADADAAGAKRVVTCQTRAVDLAKLARDPREAPAYRSRIGLIDVTGPKAALCRRFVGPARVFDGYGMTDETTPLSTARKAVSLKRVPVEIPAGRAFGGRFESGARLSVMTLDFFNAGKPVTVVEQSGDTHYFDGDRFLVSDRMVDDAALKPLDGDVEKTPDGWRGVGGEMTVYDTAADLDRYTHFALFRLAGTTYLLATPTNHNNKPDALLLKPSHGRLIQLCSFSIVGENY